MARTRPPSHSPAGFISLWALSALPGLTLAGAVPAALTTPTPTLASPAFGVVEVRQIEPTIAYVEGYKALGCFEDAGILTVTDRFNQGMTPHNCRNWCSVNSAPIFGVKNGFQCLCGTKIEPFAEKADEDECTKACFGASSLLCGAADRMNLYAPTGMDVGSFDDNAPTVTGPAGSGDATTTSGSGGNSSNDPDASGNPGSSSDGESPGNSDPTPSDVYSTAPGGANLPVGAVVGIAVGAAAMSGIITAVVMFFFCRRRRHGRDDPADQRSPPAQAMAYANTAPAQAPMSNSGTHEVYGGYKPHDGSTTQSYTLSPNSTTPSPQNAVPQQQYGRHELNAQQYTGAYEMPGAQR